jgi:hypothetical protein
MFLSRREHQEFKNKFVVDDEFISLFQRAGPRQREVNCFSPFLVNLFIFFIEQTGMSFFGCSA